jgi:ethanolamine ammonia-lyase small subunit
MTTPTVPPPDPWGPLRAHTPARIALGRTGASLPTAEVLRFAAAHAQARDAVHQALDTDALMTALRADGWAVHSVTSAAADRATYLRRPDLGRRLATASAQSLQALQAPALPPPDLALVLADGLSAAAAQQHGVAVLAHLRTALAGALRLSPVFLATQARVALGDEVGELLGARAVLVLLGERPGLSSPDSLGAYLTFAPRLGRSDAERNCVSNIRPAGLAPAPAAARLAWLVREALRLRLTGVALKDGSATPLLTPAPVPATSSLQEIQSLPKQDGPVVPVSAMRVTDYKG